MTLFSKIFGRSNTKELAQRVAKQTQHLPLDPCEQMPNIPEWFELVKVAGSLQAAWDLVKKERAELLKA